MTPGSRRHNPLHLRKLRYVGSSLDFGEKENCGVPGPARRSKKIFQETQLFLAKMTQVDTFNRPI
jgi:hypothetical protein